MFSQRQQVTVNLIGGLGNQLFQYAAGKYLANKLDTRLTLNLRQIGTGGTFREPDILQMNLKDVLVVGNIGRTLTPRFFLAPKRAYFSTLRRLTSQEKLIRRNQIFRPESDGFDPRLLEISRPMRLEGYFQTHKYADFLYEELLELCELKAPSTWYLEKLDEISFSNPIALHIRRTDYGALARSFGLLSSQYYREALNALPESLRDNKVLVFSDEISEAKKVLKHIDREFVFLEVNSFSTPAENLTLMSKCSANVIANSTFSWWGAYLNVNSSGTVAPAQWFRNMREPIKILPPNWNTIQSSWEN